MSNTPENEIEQDDLYTDDLNEALGYRPDFDWEKLDDAEIDRHDEIIEMDADEARKLDPASLTDLQRWAVAQVLADSEDLDGFTEIALELVNGAAKHPALDYGEIAVELVNDMLVDGNFEGARGLLGRVSTLIPEDPHVSVRLGAIIACLDGDLEGGMSTFQDLIDNGMDDAELLVSIAEDLVSVDQIAAATEVLARAEELAEADGLDELLLDIEHVRETIRELSNEEEEEVPAGEN